VSPQRTLLDQYCVVCHNQRLKTGGLMLDTTDVAAPSAHAEVWEKVVRKLRGGLMPPPGARQPERTAVDALVSYLETSLDRAAAAAPNPGRVSLHRLNRVEYANSIKALFAIDVDASTLLPADDISGGFDNIASVLKVSPSFLEQYVGAARAVSDLAVGDTPPSQPVTTLVRGGKSNLPPDGPGGLPLGTQGGTLVEHFFPVEGEYELKGPAGSLVFVDGARVPSGRVTIKAGTHKVGAASPARSFVESEAALHSFIPSVPAPVYGQTFGPRAGPGVVPPGAIQITGPYNPAGVALETPARQRLFVCRPAKQTDELSCATRILSTVARRAFRRPVTDADLQAPLAFFKDGRSTGTFEDGIRVGLMAILASPKFLYRAELPPQSTAAGGAYTIGDLDLASRLSFFLWSQIPDDELLDLAGKNRLSDPAVLERQVRRMLADPRSRALVTNFAAQWLNVRGLDSVEPDAVLFPSFSPDLRDAFRTEMELFVDSIFREDRSLLALLDADYTFVNERLAAHYGIPDVRGPQFRRVTLTDSHRRGLLGKGAVLMVTSYPNRTSVVLRGAWILENLLGTPPAAPPPDVEGFAENKEGEKARTVRQIMEQHRSKPTCNACHGVIDPMGFALEPFDAIGAWRSKDRDAGTSIDASGTLVDGTAIGGPDDLRQTLVRRPGQFVQTVTEKLLTYALGRNVEYYDMPAVRAIVRDAARDGYHFSSIVMGIVRSRPFRQMAAAD
jgi:mono/diheme cytochrome c family protein